MLVVSQALNGVLRDTYIVAIGALSHAVGRILFASAKVSQVFYAGMVHGQSELSSLVTQYR